MELILMARGKSLMSDESDPKCFVCGSPYVVVHHCLPGNGRRPVSDREGAWVYLCPYHHNASNDGVHFNKRLDMEIRRTCQSRWEEREGLTGEEAHDAFRNVFGISYL